ncbi:MAG: polysaccharide deacetylase family protein [Ruthenibacterium sp.]
MFYCMRKKITHLMLGGTALLLIGVAVFNLYFTAPKAQAASTVEWGLSFQTKNAPPIANVTAEELRAYDAFYCGDAGKKVLYLTFDAGYENGNLSAMLDALQKHHAPAAFFVVGHFIETEPELLKRMVDEGHTVGNHTYHHMNMANVDAEKFKEELQSLETLFESVAGRPIDKVYRPPEGKFTFENLKLAQSLGYRTIFWSLAYVDWKPDAQPTPEQAYAKLLPRAHSGAIVLLHSTSATNAAILDDLLTKWETAGYTFEKLETIC